MRLPFVSREHHEAVLAERERVIDALREQVAMFEKRLDQPVPVTVTLPKDFAVIQPAVVQSKRRKKKDEDQIDPRLNNIDLAEVDELDLKLCAQLAVAKYGRKASNQWELQMFIRGIQTEIRAAKAAKRRRQAKEQGKKPEVTELQEGIDLDSDVDAPEHIKQMIAEAEGGK